MTPSAPLAKPLAKLLAAPQDQPSRYMLGTVLLVDDDRIVRSLLTAQLEQIGYNVIEAENGAAAFTILENRQYQIDLILLDREMPVMDGMQFISHVKKNYNAYRQTPIVMITGYGHPDHIGQGISAGVFYYLVKPVSQNLLASVVASAHREARQLKKLDEISAKQDTSFSLMNEGYFCISTLDDAEHLSRMLAQCFDDPERAVSGISALMVNAIEHGNLEIGFNKKSELLHSGQWLQEVLRRQELPQYRNRRVHVTYQKTPEQHRLIIRDEGKGFDWQAYRAIDTKKMAALNGRGIVQASQLSFDKIQYNPEGNQATAITNYYKK